MAHATGIMPCQALADSFAAEREGKQKRFLKIKIANDEMVEADSYPFTGTQEEDFAKVPSYLDDQEPAYVLFRSDPNKTTSDQWVAVLFVPDTAAVKDKMVYSASKDFLKKSLGYSHFCGDLFATEKSEVTFDNFMAYKEMDAATDPLTESEIQKKFEAKLEIVTGSEGAKHTVRFPMSDGAKARVADMKSGSTEFVELSLDTDKETVELVDTSASLDLDALNKREIKEPRYYILAWKKDGTTKFVFALCCPDLASVKNKMLYSSVKSSTIESIEADGLTFDRKFQMSGPDELTKAYLDSELFPVAEQNTATTFSKPKRAGGGGRRLHKSGGDK
eukprot:GFYU01002203.1.p1 GENE.GFYU01002203.1~~GFYU01002203.1.p1  ORF type:complete len:334 (+),score=128.79 GFYU01002203.1:39-1040(+)